MEKFLTQNFSQTKELGEKFAKEILQKNQEKTAVVLALEGDLGAGKTTFLQGVAKGLGIKEKVLSPTFILMKSFELNGKNFKNFYHIDCYRLKDEKDLEILGFEEILADPKNIIAVEWSERVKSILPGSKISIDFKHLKGDKREIVIGG